MYGWMDEPNRAAKKDKLTVATAAETRENNNRYYRKAARAIRELVIGSLFNEVSSRDIRAQMQSI
jgi:hypothetical protein